MAERQLPVPFQDLESYLAWSLPTARARRAKRESSTMGEITAFYGAILPRMEEILPYLDRFPLENIPGDVQALLYLTFSLAEVAPAVEMYGEPAVEGLDTSRLAQSGVYSDAV
jgi:hypothetical protein